MNIRIEHGSEGAARAVGTAVVIDVFRAFTTAAWCIGSGAEEIILVADSDDALALKRDDPLLFLTGEIDGRPIPGFDAPNSPSQIATLDLRGRRVVQRTSSGVQAVVAASRSATRIVLGSYVIASATLREIERDTEVTLVASGGRGSDMEIGGIHEDDACARYLAGRLNGDGVDATAPFDWFDPERIVWPEWFPRADAILACTLDRFDFALPVVREAGQLVARPVRH